MVTSAQPTEAQSSATPESTEPGVVVTLWDWQTVLGPGEVCPPSAYDGEVAFVCETDVVIDGVRRRIHTIPDGWLLDDALLGDGWVVIRQHDDATLEFQILLYPVDGDPMVVDEGQGHIPQVSFDGSFVAWNVRSDSGRQCIRVLAIATQQRSDAVCSESSGFQWPYVRWPTLSYVEVADLASDPCPTFTTLHLPDGTPERHEVHRCQAFNGAADEQAIIWTEAPIGSPFVERSPVYGREPGGCRTISLGRGALGSHAVCDGRAYWISYDPDVQGGLEVRSWVPGGAIEVIYRPPTDARPTTKPECQGGWVSFERTREDLLPGIHDELIAARVPGSSPAG